MTVFYKELKQGRKAWFIWSTAIAFMLVICVVLFPEMKGEMDDISDMFANMGGFTAAFGMDQLNFGDMMGFYGIECGNILGIGGGFFAAFIGISILSKEEKERTAEFLFTHPVSRASILTQKLLAVLTEIVVMNLAITGISAISIAMIGETIAGKEFILLHLAYLILQIEIACICFGISAFIHRGSIGIGLGLAAVFYFMNLICNISDQTEFLKYFTPYSFAEASDIISEAKLDGGLIVIGVIASVIGVLAGYMKYTRKDIAA